mgnify:CR=1 FL=1|jgi:hypothetical protein
MLKEDVCKVLAKVRETGLVNMFDYQGVLKVINDLDLDSNVFMYIYNNKDKYIDLLKESANY